VRAPARLMADALLKDTPPTAKVIDPGGGHPAVAEAGGGGTAPRHLARALQIATVLQTSLELEKVIELFSREVAETIPHSSIAYRNSARQLQLTLGEPAACQVSYRLVVAGQPVGQLGLSRERAFTEAETQELEYLLCSLVYPLLNALKYREAVDSALTDALTGLANRKVFETALEREVKLARRHGTPLSLIVVDIDDFKTINDRFGHSQGDAVLRTVARALADCVRDTDVLARFGGEEFVLLLNNTGREGACRLAERLRSSVAHTVTGGDPEFLEVTVSLGVASLAADDGPHSLFERADQALYRAKAEGKNRFCFQEAGPGGSD